MMIMIRMNIIITLIIRMMLTLMLLITVKMIIITIIVKVMKTLGIHPPLTSTPSQTGSASGSTARMTALFLELKKEEDQGYETEKKNRENVNPERPPEAVFTHAASRGTDHVTSSPSSIAH